MNITGDEIRRLFYYEPSTGWLIRRVSISNNTNISDIIGWANGNGYLRTTVYNKRYYVHQLIWLYHFDILPIELDHKDNNSLNNTIENLRLCDRSENMKNKGKQINNTSGYKGVSFHKQCKKWTARIQLGVQYKYLGLFNSPEEAHAAYCAAGQHHGKFFNDGISK